MINDMIILIFGFIIGFSIFIYTLVITEGIFYRPNMYGGWDFTLIVFYDYLLAPFDIGSRRFNTVWANYKKLTIIDRIKLLQMNWVAMTLFGLLVSASINLLKNIF